MSNKQKRDWRMYGVLILIILEVLYENIVKNFK